MLPRRAAGKVDVHLHRGPSWRFGKRLSVRSRPLQDHSSRARSVPRHPPGWRRGRAQAAAGVTRQGGAPEELAPGTGPWRMAAGSRSWPPPGRAGVPLPGRLRRPPRRVAGPPVAGA